jgi:hypothetical protein
VIALIASATVATTTPVCEDAALFDPAALTFADGPLPAARRACPRSELALGGAAIVIAEPEEFYGNLRAAATLAAAWALDSETELFAAIEVLRYQTVISSLDAETFGLGHLALGGTRRIWTEQPATTLALTAHATLPTAVDLYEETCPFALDLGLTGTTRISADLELHAYAGTAATIGAGSGPADPRAALILDAGAAYRPWTWLALVLDLQGAAGARAVLDHAALGAGMRFRVAGGFRIDLLLTAPLAGDERALASAYLGVAYWEGT